jgi:hypothetical protein
MYRGWTQIEYQNSHCIIDQRDKGTWDDRGGDGRTNFTLRIKERATRLTLHEHDDDDDDDDYAASIFWVTEFRFWWKPK